ncbi:hypothetical protein [Fluviicola sp.]|uniref:hypothetical protein n=1 Tax=Fluviicola sp. TaxID=1917219 RepID=UPI0031DF8A96
MLIENYEKILADLRQLGFEPTNEEKSELKVLMESDERRIFWRVDGHIEEQEYYAVFMLVRPKNDLHYAIREYRFSIEIAGQSIAQIFPVIYNDPFMADVPKEPITRERAANLLCGRAIFDEAQGCWLQLDLSRTNQELNLGEVGNKYLQGFEHPTNYVVNRFPDFDLSRQVGKLVPDSDIVGAVISKLYDGKEVAIEADNSSAKLTVAPVHKHLRVTSMDGKQLSVSKRYTAERDIPKSKKGARNVRKK